MLIPPNEPPSKLPWVIAGLGIIAAGTMTYFWFHERNEAANERSLRESDRAEQTKFQEVASRKVPVVEEQDVPDVMKHLTPLLRTENDDARAKAVELAGAIAPNDSVEMLQKMVKTDPSIKVRVVSLDVIGRHKLEACRGAALQALAESDLALRRKAAWCLGQFGKSTDPEAMANTRVALMKALKEEHAQWLDSVTKKEEGSKGVPKLTLMPIASGSAAGRLNPYIEALGLAGDGSVVLELAFCLTNPDPMVRRVTAQALGAIGAAESKAELLTRFRSEKDPLAQEAIISALTGSSYKMKYDAKARNFTEPQ
jgi:HEAT repeat protein